MHIIRASSFPPLPFTAPIDPAGILNPKDKVRLVETERTQRGLETHACVAYGDSMSDQPLFTVLDNTVAVNADERLEASARAAYRGEDLRDAYVEGRKLLNTN
jgi:phosphoserine phosphatase